MILFSQQRTYSDHFAGAGKVIAGGKENVPKMELDAGVLVGEKK